MCDCWTTKRGLTRVTNSIKLYMYFKIFGFFAWISKRFHHRFQSDHYTHIASQKQLIIKFESAFGAESSLSYS